MLATPKSDGATPKGDVELRLRLEVYDALAERHGVPTVAAQAALHGIHRGHMFRIRNGDRTPSLSLAMKMAADFGTTVEALFGRQVT